MSLTEKILSGKNLSEKILSQIPGDPLKNLRQADQLWQSIKDNTMAVPQTVQQNLASVDTIDWDVVICGGTLGIILGATLAMGGYRVALIERGTLRGREQEWNISRKELDVFLALNLLTAEELEIAITTEYNPARICFPNSPEIWVKDVLNIGIDPVYLLETLKTRFLAAGGCLFENTAFEAATVHPNGVMVAAKTPLPHQPSSFATRLLIDAMGHFSPIVRQARQGKKPDAVCLVVGTCATGFPANETGDIFAAFTPMQNQCQYFWEAFPAKNGRTTYLFTYVDAHPSRFSLEFLFEEYLRLLPEYQNIDLNQLQFQRALFGFFPCYQQPLTLPWDRILPVGDSSGTQSPLSFGGFGAMVRHLKRLTHGIDEALQINALNQAALAKLQPYQPSLAVTWMFQRSMSVEVNQTLDSEQINQLLAGVFQVMASLGEPVLKPFLQDVVQFAALSKTLFKTSILHPNLVVKVIPQVGVVNLLNWMVHYGNLAIYTALHPLGQIIVQRLQFLSPIQQYYCRRWVEQLQYGSGGDYDREKN